jgi:hypothetical protein
MLAWLLSSVTYHEVELAMLYMLTLQSCLLTADLLMSVPVVANWHHPVLLNSDTHHFIHTAA